MYTDKNTALAENRGFCGLSASFRVAGHYGTIRNHCRACEDGSRYAGRGEDWRGIPKVEPSRCSPFPLGVPQ
jgi:hypothetical protein